MSQILVSPPSPPEGRRLHSILLAIMSDRLFNEFCNVLFTRVEDPTFAKKFVLFIVRFVFV